MAFYPCSNHHAPYRGPSAAAYPAIVNGTTADRKHLRLCLSCFAEYVDQVAKVLTEVKFDVVDASEALAHHACSFCGTGPEDKKVFLTAYPNKAPERAFYGSVCSACEPRARAEVLLS